MNPTIPLQSQNGSLDYAIAQIGGIKEDPIDGDPRRIIKTVPMLLRGVTAPLEGPGATFQGKQWWVTSVAAFPARCYISLKLQRACLAQCCAKANIKTLERSDDCQGTDHVKSITQCVPTVTEHVQSYTQHWLDADHDVDDFYFYFEAPFAMTQKNVIEYGSEEYKVSRVLSVGNPLELTKVLAQRVALARAIA